MSNQVLLYPCYILAIDNKNSKNTVYCIVFNVSV